MPPIINKLLCNGCGICDINCPMDIIAIDAEKKLAVVKYPNECWHCGSCRQDCPKKAIEIRFGPEMLYC